MRNLKRALSLALASVMLLGMMVVGSSAASFPDVSSEDNTEAIAVLEAVEVMIGNEKGEFEPDKNVTRNEMAVILAKLILGRDADKYVGTCPFTDVPEWAQKYVAACYDNKIVAGRTESIYDGSATVTAQEAAAMVLRVLGYQKLEDSGTNWAQPVVAKANEIRLFASVGSSATAPMTRNQVAQLSLNALQATMVNTTSGTNIDLGEIGSITTDVKYEDRTTTDKWKDSIDSATNGDGDCLLQLGEYLYEGKLEKLTENVTDAAGRPGTQWEYDGDKVGTYGVEADRTYVVSDGDKTVNDVLTSKDYFNYISGRMGYATWNSTANRSEDGKTTVSVNGDEIAATSASTPGGTKLNKGDVVEVYLYDETEAVTSPATPRYYRNDVEAIVVLRYQAAEIDEIDTDVNSDQKDDGVSAILSLKDVVSGDDLGDYYDAAKVDSDSEDKLLRGYGAGYDEGAFIAVAISNSNEIVDSYVIDVVTGKVTSSRNVETSDGRTKNGYVTVDGTRYNYVGGLSSVPSYDKDSEYDVYTTREGYALAVKGAEGVSLNDVYYVVGVYNVANNYGKDTWYAQSVLISDGTVKDIKLDSDFVNGYPSKFDLDDMLAKHSSHTLYLLTVDTNEQKSAGTDDKDAASAREKILYAVTHDGLYTFDKDGEPEVWDGDSDYDIVSAALLNDDVKSDDTRIRVGGSRYYINENTKYVAIDDFGDDIDVKFSANTMSAKANGSMNAILIRDGSDAVYVIYLGEVKGAAEDIVYLAEKPNSKDLDADAWEATLYFMDDNRSEEVLIDETSAPDPGFYTYSINSDDLYELDNADSDKLNYTNDVRDDAFDSDSEGWLSGLTIKSNTGNMLSGTFNDGADRNISGVEFGSAKIVDDDKDNHDELYNSEISSISRLKSALKVGWVVADVYVTDGDITFIYVTDMTPEVPVVEIPDGGTASDINSGLDEVEEGGSAEVANPDLSGDGGNVTVPANKTLTITGGIAAEKGGTIEGAGNVEISGGTISDDVVVSTPSATLDGVTVAAGTGVTVEDVTLSGDITLNGTLTINGDVTIEAGTTITGAADAQIVVEDGANVDALAGMGLKFFNQNGDEFELTATRATVEVEAIPAGTYAYDESLQGWKRTTLYEADPDTGDGITVPTTATVVNKGEATINVTLPAGATAAVASATAATVAIKSGSESIGDDASDAEQSLTITVQGVKFDKTTAANNTVDVTVTVTLADDTEVEKTCAVTVTGRTTKVTLTNAMLESTDDANATIAVDASAKTVTVTPSAVSPSKDDEVNVTVVAASADGSDGSTVAGTITLTYTDDLNGDGTTNDPGWKASGSITVTPENGGTADTYTGAVGSV